LGGASFGQFSHDAPALGSRQTTPASDFIDGASASEAKALMDIESADFHAGGLDHEMISKPSRP
jgi:hypothetical protein